MWLAKFGVHTQHRLSEERIDMGIYPVDPVFQSIIRQSSKNVILLVIGEVWCAYTQHRLSEERIDMGIYPVDHSIPIHFPSEF